MLMDHMEEKRDDDNMITSVVHFILNICNIRQFTEKEILHVIGKERIRILTMLLLQVLLIPMPT